MRRAGPEEQLQRAVAQYLDLRGVLWWHTPNGGYRRRTEAARMAGMGVRPGVPDVLIFEPWEHRGAHGFGLAIELKTARGRLTPAQRDMLAALDRRGWWATVCRSIDEVVDTCSILRPADRPGRAA